MSALCLPCGEDVCQDCQPELFQTQVPLLSAAAALIALVAPTAVKSQSMFDHMVVKKYTAAMQADFDKAGKTPPAGLIQQTCGCVAQQLDSTHNLEMAKTICTQQAQAGM